MVLDASAVIAMLAGEPGGALVRKMLEGAAMTTVNLAEVGGYLARGGGAREEIQEVLDSLSLMIVPADVDLAVDAAMFQPLTRAAGLSLGDRFCLALAKRLDRAVLTSDRAWASVADSVGVQVQLIR